MVTSILSVTAAVILNILLREWLERRQMSKTFDAQMNERMTRGGTLTPEQMGARISGGEIGPGLMAHMAAMGDKVSLDPKAENVLDAVVFALKAYSKNYPGTIVGKFLGKLFG